MPSIDSRKKVIIAVAAKKCGYRVFSDATNLTKETSGETLVQSGIARCEAFGGERDRWGDV